MRLLPQLVATALLCSSFAGAQGTVATDAAAQGAMIPARLARIDAWVQQQVNDRKIPGAVVMIVRDGRVAYYKAFGMRDLATRTPQRRDDIFRIASQ